MKSFSQTEIANYAISAAGGNAINSVPDGNKKESNLIVQFWDITLLALLEEHNWRFARKWASLAEDAGYTFVDDQFDAAWALPSDFVRFSDQEGVGPTAITFERRGNHLLTAGLTEFEIEYIKHEDDLATTGNFPPHFVVALYTALAREIAPDLRRKGAKNNSNFIVLADAALTRAKTKDSQQDNRSEERKTRHTADTDSWIQARLS
jgi:hypothetical protein